MDESRELTINHTITMKKRYLLALLPVMTLAIVGTASAHGFGFFGINHATPEEIASRHQEMFQRQAELLGISVDDLKNAWAEGKTIGQIIDEKGLNKNDIQKRAQDAALEQMKSHLQTLVDKGVITQAQADKRLQFMSRQIESGKLGGHIGHMGMGMRFWR